MKQCFIRLLTDALDPRLPPPTPFLTAQVGGYSRQRAGHPAPGAVL
jgi:hypothetical protein